MGSVTGGLADSKYYAVNGGSFSSYTDRMTGGICSVGGVISNLYFYLGAAAVGTCRLRLYKNGVETDLAAAITAGNTSGSDTNNEVAVVAGDRLTVYYTGDAGALGHWNMEIDSGYANFGLIMSGGFKCSANPTVSYISLNSWGYYDTPPATEAYTYCVSPIACVISRLYIENWAWPFAAGDTTTVTLRVNGADSTLQAVAVGNIGKASDLVHSVAIAKGDRLNWSVLSSGTGQPVPQIGALITPAVEANQQAIWISGAGYSLLNTVATQYALLLPSSPNICMEEAHNYLVAKANTRISNLYVRLRSAPGLPASGAAYIFTARVNGADTALTCTVLETATAAEDAVNVVSLAAGDRIDLKIVPTNGPSPVYAGWGAVISGLAPTVTGITPATGQIACQVQVTLTGTNLEEAGAVDLGADISCVITSRSATAILVTVSISSSAALTARDVVVDTAVGTATLPAAFTVVGNTATEVGVATAPVSSIAGSQAVLNGYLEENAGAPATAWFEWGSTTAYGNSTPRQMVSYKGGSFSATISPLTPGGYYHVRAVIQTGMGTFYGNDTGFSAQVQPHLMSLITDSALMTLIE
jgi:hypothetical protein